MAPLHDDVGDPRPLAPDPLLHLARERVRGGERRLRVEAQREMRNATARTLDKAQLPRRRARSGAHDANDRVGIAPRLARRDAVPGARWKEGLDVGLDALDLGRGLHDRALDLRGDGVRLVEGEVAWELQVERELRRVVHGHDAQVVHLAHARHAHGRRVCTLAHRQIAGFGLDVDHDVRVRQHALHRPLDRVRRRVSLADRGSGRNADHDVCEMPPRRLTHAQAAELHGRLHALDREPGGLVRSHRIAIHQHVHVLADEAGGRDENEHGDQQCGDRVAVGVAGAREEEANEHRRRAEQVAAEVERVRRERRAPVTPRAAPGHDRPADVDGDDQDDDGEGVPRGVDIGAGVPEQMRERALADEEARHDEKSGLGECRQVLCLAVPVGVARVGGPPRTPMASSVRRAATRSVPEWSASETSPRLPVASPVTSFSATRIAAARTETSAMRRGGGTREG